MNSKKLDQFYTKKEVASDCYQLIKKNIELDEYILIEPSAGTGSFSNLFHSNSIALDLEPKKEGIIKQDFFNFQPININEKITTIGNPPFGKNSSLAIRFFNKSAQYSDYICMILPRTFKKNSVINKLDLSFHLILEKELDKNSFIFEGKEYNVPCVFQIWEKRKEKREKIKQKTKTDLFNFVSKGEADFAIRRVGGLAGKVIIDFEHYKESSHYYIKVKGDKAKNELILYIQSLYPLLNKKASDTAGNPSLSKAELIDILEGNRFINV